MESAFNWFAVLVAVCLVAWCANANSLQPDSFTRKQRIQRLRHEAMNVSRYTESLLMPFRGSSGIVKNGTESIHELIEHLQNYGDKKHIKKYFIGDLSDTEE